MYKQYCPDKLANIPSLLQKYKGKELEIAKTVDTKYKLNGTLVAKYKAL